MLNITKIDILDQLVVVNLNVRIWSARRKLMPEDLGNADLPPEDLASLGSKRICDPEELKFFTTLKARAVSLLERGGVRFLNGWAIPAERMEAISNELSTVRDEFGIARDKFLLRYDQAVQEWIGKHPQWASIIAGSVVSEEYVRSRMDFRWQIFRIVPPESNGLQDDLRNDIDNLGNTLFAEVAAAATEAWHRCYAGKAEVTRKALSPLKSIHEKLVGLSFMEPRIGPVADLLQTAFDNIPKRGAINGGTLIMLQGLVSLLRNPADLLEHADTMLAGRRGSQDILEGFIGAGVSVSQGKTQADSDADEEPRFVEEPPVSLPVLESCGLW
jgi:hypothetical protein